MFKIFSTSKIAKNIFNGNLTEKISQIFTHKKLDNETLQELEDILIINDLGTEVAKKITQKLKSQKF